MISILGCGWLGFPLAQHLLTHGYNVKGSTTTAAKQVLLEKNGIDNYLISIPDDLDDPASSEFWTSKILFLNIPPGRGSKNVEKQYTELIEAVRDRIARDDSGIERVIFASSTSVYPSSEGHYTEQDTALNDTARPSGSAILKAEQLLQESNKFSTVVVRFGGLYGYERHPVKYLSGRKNISSPLKPVNLIHQADCIGIVHALIQSDIKEGVFNAVSDGHPPRKTLYQSAAKHYDLPPPEFDNNSPSVDRIISNEKLKENLGYKFTYPNPLDHTA